MIGGLSPIFAGTAIRADKALPLHPKRSLRSLGDRSHPEPEGRRSRGGVTAAVISRGLTVLRPLCEGRRYDLVIDLEPALLRVQCKLARRVRGVLAISLETCRYTPNGYVRTHYSTAEIDAIGAYSPELGRCYLLPMSAITTRRSVHLRMQPTGNNQAERINWAREHELEPVLERLRAG